MRRACALSLAPLWALLGTSCQEQTGKCSNHTENLCLQFELADHGTPADAIKLTVSSATQNRTFDFPNIAAQLAARPYVVEITFDTSAPAAVDLDVVASVNNSAAGAGVRPVAAAKLTMLAPATAARPTRIVLQTVAGNDLGMPTGDLQGGTLTDGGTPADFTPTAWKMVYASAGTPLNALFGISGTTKIYAAGNKGLVVSGDGNSFTPTATAGAGTLSGIWVASAMAAFACDKQGTAFRTADGGATWTPNTTAGFALSAISGRSATDVLAVGSDFAKALHWNGTSWSLASHNLGVFFSGVFASSSNYYAIGTSGVGGRALTPQTVPWTSVTKGAADAQWIMAGLGTTDSFTVAVSTTGAVQYVTGTAAMPTWTSITPPGNTLSAVWVPAVMSPVVGGLGGTVYQYASGTWSSLGNVGAGYNITGLWGDSSGTLWATASNGADGAIFKH